MIQNVGDLLQALMVREAAILSEQDVDHTPTIGAMYEGLTQDALRRTLPIDAPISVVSGFARGPGGKKSRQLDCMVVTGDGEPIPYTSMFNYPVEQVLVVIEVKKTLYQQQFEEGFQNLRSVLDLDPVGTLPVRKSLASAFQLISGHALPDDPKDIKDPVLRQLYHQLVVEVLSPARILLGYEGYKTVGALRKGLVSHLRSIVENGGAGAGPASMPDLVMNPHAAVLKSNGFPIAAPMRDGRWPLLLSVASAKPALMLLEVVWTRLHIRVGGSPEMFGNDLELETVIKLVDYKYVPEKSGWELECYPDIADKKLEVCARQKWEPVFLSEIENVLVMWLCAHEEIDLSSPPVGVDLHELDIAVKRLATAGLLGPDASRPTAFRLLTKECATVILPDGRIAAGENVSGRLARWVSKHGMPV